MSARPALTAKSTNVVAPCFCNTSTIFADWTKEREIMLANKYNILTDLCLSTVILGGGEQAL